MLLEIVNIAKYFGQRKIIELNRLVLSRGDKVAVTGRNGSGKTTLLHMIAGHIAPDKGHINVRGSIGVIAQLEAANGSETDPRITGKLGIDCGRVYSGGEKTKDRIAKAFSKSCDILLADEPTTNLDIAGIRCLEEMLMDFRGGLMIVSHDRALLKKVCTRVLEIDRGVCMFYRCGYEEYLEQKAMETTACRARYEKYVTEKARLKNAAAVKARQSARVRKAPRRMGNSEARLHRMGDQKAKAKLDSAAKAALTRLEQLEKVEKPWGQKAIVFDVRPGAVHHPVLVRVDDVSKAYGGRSILEHCSFIVPDLKKTALIGGNGSGKTTLLDMIAKGADGIETCANLKIGYFRQDTGDLNDDKSVIGNAMDGAIYDQCFVRTILSRLLFKRDEIGNKTGVISGGERIKLSIAKVILGGFNLLVLDEPTNYLDIESRNALESVLAVYPGALLFVSHDREFLSRVADRIVCIENKTACTFEGRLKLFTGRSL
ncbi:MAG: ABC-F family ATP-binding cassette domain-containing protein [Eubacteriales bacterium]|nr:ABC-F family ATP-binding cassette domain-containing protein [Eubacteriales bacterium]